MRSSPSRPPIRALALSSVIFSEISITVVEVPPADVPPV
jgi:hypothetical protein